MTGTAKPLPARAEVIVVGGGVVGASVAYHLTKFGVSDVLVLERHQLTSGTTWHAAGLVAQMRATENLTKLARYSLDLYADLEAQTDLLTGFRQPGALSLATTPERWEELRRTAAMARRLGVTAEEVSPAEAQTMSPMMRSDDLVGAIWLPEDGVVGPVDVTMALARAARNGGATIREGVEVTELLVDNGRSVGVRVRADGGDFVDVESDTVVLAGGLWTRHLAATAGVRVPLQAAHHHYVVTEPIDGLDPDGPVLRDPDHWSYLKPEAGGSMLVGLFEPTGIPWPNAGAPPTDKGFVALEADADHLANWIGPAFDRLPALHDVGLRLVFDGPESFTPDDAYILGESPEVDGVFVAAGFNSIGIQSAGGAGMVTARWIIDGRPPLDVHDVDIARFERFQSTETYLRDRTTEVLGLLYAPHWPHRQKETARDVRRSPLHGDHLARGAYMAEVAGWERPMFFDRSALDRGELDVAYSWGRQNWHEANRVEHEAVRTAVGVFDQTSFAKFLVKGPDAAAVLDRISANAVVGVVGKVTYTQWCDENGGILSDLTVTRLADEQFLVVTGAGVRVRDFTYLERACRSMAAEVVDVTSGYAVLGVMGPNARNLLDELTSADLSNEAFPFATAQEIEFGSAIAHALRVTYVGELGWELYVPTEFASRLYEDLLGVGGAHGLVPCGFQTLNSCRFEKGYRHWGHDITPDETPIEAGLSFAVAWDKEADFVGRSALEAQREVGASKRLVHLALRDDDGAVADPNVLLHHNEPLYRDGERVGYVTGGMWGHTVGAAVGLGWAKHDQKITADWVNAGRWQVELPGGLVAAEASLRPFYDPKSERVKV